MTLLHHYMSQLYICTLLDRDCSIVIFITQAASNCYIYLVTIKLVILFITILTDELHWMTVSGVVALVVQPISEML